MPSRAATSAAIRTELDTAWGLDAADRQAHRQRLRRSPSTARSTSPSYASGRAAANKIIRAKDFPAQLKDPHARARRSTARSPTRSARAAAAGGPRARASSRGTRSTTRPTHAAVASSGSACRRRSTTDSPVVTSWKVDFNALSSASVFSFDELKRRGPGKQGGHMTVMHDYQARGPRPRSPQGRRARDARADDEGASPTAPKIQFVRVKNSWGGIRPDRWNQAAIAGYHDLEMKYLDGPIKECPRTRRQDGHDEVHERRDAALGRRSPRRLLIDQRSAATPLER